MNSNNKKTKGMSYNSEELYPNQQMLSSSQFRMYKRDPSEFFKRYVLGVKNPRFDKSEAIHFGRVLAATFEDEDFDWRTAFDEFNDGKGIRPYRLYDLLPEAIEKLPSIPTELCEFSLKAQHEDWVYRATLDAFVPDMKSIIEVKSGQLEWTQERVDNADQLTFAAWCYWKINKELPELIRLFWVDTGANPERTIQTFDTERTEKQLEDFTEQLETVVHGIETKHWTNPVLETVQTYY